jgi:hypothetical protein
MKSPIRLSLGSSTTKDWLKFTEGMKLTASNPTKPKSNERTSSGLLTKEKETEEK